MKEGDLVRFAKWQEMSTSDIRKSKDWSKVPKNHVGVLIKHDKLVGTAHILHEGIISKIRVVFVEKAGKADFEKASE